MWEEVVNIGILLLGSFLIYFSEIKLAGIVLHGLDINLLILFKDINCNCYIFSTLQIMQFLWNFTKVFTYVFCYNFFLENFIKKCMCIRMCTTIHMYYHIGVYTYRHTHMQIRITIPINGPCSLLSEEVLN